MKVLLPKSFSIVENQAISSDYDAIAMWASGASYAAGAKVIRATPADNPAINIAEIDYIYEAAGANTTTDPALDPLSWINLGATDRYKLFDRTASSQTEYAQGSSVSILAHRISAIFLGRARGRFQIDVFLNGADGMPAQIFSAAIEAEALIYEPTSGWYDYFYPVLLGDLGAVDSYAEFPVNDYDMTIRVSALSDACAIGRLVVGSLYPIGETKIAPSVGILDYSKKDTDANGETYLAVGKYAKKAEFDLIVETSKLDHINALLSRFRATPALWVGSTRFSSLMIYGFYRDFSLLLQGEEFSECAIQIEGLT
jgi:hypothetical protein